MKQAIRDINQALIRSGIKTKEFIPGSFVLKFIKILEFIRKNGPKHTNITLESCTSNKIVK